MVNGENALMNKFYVLPWWMVCLAIVTFSCQSSRQALKLMQKGKYEKAQLMLDKSLLKDSLNPAAHYVYSLLFADTAYQYYQVDSSYAHILLAMADYEQAEVKMQQKLAKQMQLDSVSLLQQRLRTDSLAFAEAADLHTVEAYQTFIDEHTGKAPQFAEAIRRRNQLAYQAAKQKDTYQAYKSFMETYPDAEQFDAAQERYNTLVFREKTKGGNLESYLNFLKAFPNSPYRSNAEEQILKISTAGNDLLSYASFARQFPESPYARLAVDLLFHLYKTRHEAQHFLSDFPNLPFADSLRQIIEAENMLLMPVLENDRYGFIDSQGTQVIAPQYPLIAARYLCEGVPEDYIYVATIKGSHLQHILLTKTGKTTAILQQDDLPNMASGPFTSGFITDAGNGLLLVQAAPDGYILQQKAGHVVMPESYERIDTIAFVSSPASAQAQSPAQFVKFQVKGLWGLMAFNGTTLLEPLYDDIEDYNAFIVIEKEGKLAVTNRESLIRKANQVPLELSFLYDEVALIDQEYLIAYRNEYETVLNERLETEVPAGKYNIIRRINHQHQWLLKKETIKQSVKNDSLINSRQTAYFLYNSRQHELPQEYQKAYYNQNWLALQGRNGFAFFNFTTDSPHQLYDSVKILSENLALLFQKDSVTAYFSNQKQLTFERFSGRKEIQFRLFKASAPDFTGRQNEYLLIIKEDKKQVVNHLGESLFAASFDDITAYDSTLFSIERKGKKGLVNQKGETLVPVSYQSIGNYKEGMLAIFHDQQFGLYYHPTQTLIKPAYEAVAQRYGSVTTTADSTSHTLFIARKKGKYGIINQANENLTSFTFDEIQYWNDSTALVKSEDQWQLYWLTAPAQTPEEDKILMEGISDFEVLESDSSQEQLLKIYKDQAYGIMSNKRGAFIPATYDEVLLVQHGKDQLFLTEKYIAEADLYIMLYLNASGEMIKRQALTADQYDMIYCDEGYL